MLTRSSHCLPMKEQKLISWGAAVGEGLGLVNPYFTHDYIAPEKSAGFRGGSVLIKRLSLLGAVSIMWWPIFLHPR